MLEQDDLRRAGDAGQSGGSEGADAGVHLHHVGASDPGHVRAGRGCVADGQGQERRRRGLRRRGLRG